MNIICKDESCVACKQCSRFTTNLEKNQPRFALTPREGNACVFFEGNNPEETRKNLQFVHQ